MEGMKGVVDMAGVNVISGGEAMRKIWSYLVLDADGGVDEAASCYEHYV